MLNNTLTADEAQPASKSSSARRKVKNTVKVFSNFCLADEENAMRYNDLNNLDEYDEGLRKLKGFDLLTANLTHDQIKTIDLSEVHPQISLKLIEKYDDIFSENAE